MENDPWLLQTQQLDPLQYPIKTINNHNIIYFREIINHLDQHQKICIPPALVQQRSDGITWYSDIRFTRTIQYNMLNLLFWSICTMSVVLMPQQLQHVQKQWETMWTIDTQHLAPRQALLLAPWRECTVNLMDPWKIPIHGREKIFKALTAIDPVTNLLEIIWITNNSSQHISQQFSNCWLYRYPQEWYVTMRQLNPSQGFKKLATSQTRSQCNPLTQPRA